MKKLLAILIFTGSTLLTVAQSGDKANCDKTSCGPEGTKTAEAKAVTALRADLQSVIEKMSRSSVSFNKNISAMKISAGTSDDESLLFISQAATVVRTELISKIDPPKLVPSLKNYEPALSSSKQEMFASLKKEIEILNTQADKL